MAGDNADPRDDVSVDDAAAWDDQTAAGPASTAASDGTSASTGTGDGHGSDGVHDAGSFDPDEFERASEVDDITESMPRPEAGTDRPDGTDDPYAGVDVAQVLAERDELRTMAQRIQADYDNYRKRSAKDIIAESDRATGRLAEALLPVLDAAEAAYVNHPDEVGPLLNQMLTELKRHGLEVLDLDGKPFDPEFAEAVAHEPGGGGEPMVVDVLRSGYSWKGKTLRPAMVRTKD